MMHSRFRLTLALFVPAAIFIFLGFFVSGEKLLEIGRGAMLSVCAGVAASHFPLARRAFGPVRPLDEAAVLSLGWFMIAGSTVCWCGWYLFWRSVGSPSLWWDEYLLAVLAYVTSTGGILVLQVVHATNGIVPARAWWGLGIKTAVGVAAVLTTLSVIHWMETTGIGPP
jgi:hypothetical protein